MKFIDKLESKSGLSSGTALFMFSAFLLKLIGGVYKIPLYNLLGGYGIGLYQMVFPVYALLLTLSGSGIPNAMTKLIASGNKPNLVLKKCLNIFLPLSTFFCVLLVVFSKKIAILQGDVNAQKLYFAIAPSVIFVSLIACLRGYFQGKSRLKPTSVSQLIEQCVKAVSGVIALLLVKGNAVVKGCIACFAVTLSELFALCFLALKFKKENKLLSKNSLKGFVSYKSILAVIIPITLTALCLPLGAFLDSFFALNFLKFTYPKNATQIYGLYTGGVDTVVSLPTSILLCLTVGFLPKLSKEGGGKKSIFLIFLLACFFGVAIIIFAPLIGKILFSSAHEFLPLLIKLLRFASLNVILLSTLQATNNYLIAKSKQFYPLVSLFFGLAVKIIIDLTVIKIPQINVFGMIISDCGCYFVALVLNLVYIYYIENFKRVAKGNENHFNWYGRRQKRAMQKGRGCDS